MADDDEDDQYLIQQALRDILGKHSIQTALNGLQVVDLLLENREEEVVPLPDIILLDLNMPLLDGFGVLGKLRAHENTRSIPVFILSTSRFDHDRKRSEEMGASGFYSKPYQYEELKSIIRTICTAGASS